MTLKMKEIGFQSLGKSKFSGEACPRNVPPMIICFLPLCMIIQVQHSTSYIIMAIETPDGNRSLVMNITAQYIILSSGIIEPNKNEPVDNPNNL